MRQAQRAFHIAKIIGIILTRTPSRDRASLLSDYLRIRLKYHVLHVLLRRPIHEERILDYRVRFFDYFWLLYLFEEVFINRVYAFRPTRAPKLIIDGGASFGMATLFFARYHPQARILAFEPDAQTYAALAENAAANGLRNVQPLQRALAETPGVVSFYSDPDQPGAPGMSMTSGTWASKVRSEVEAVALSEVISEPVDLLKLDIEGAERGVIRELARSGKLALVEQFIVEYHHHLDPQADELADVLATLEEHGFGYQVASQDLPHRAGQVQDIHIYAYRKGATKAAPSHSAVPEAERIPTAAGHR